MNVYELGSVVAITVICYLVGMIIKASPVDNKWIPCIIGFLGGIIGILAWKVMPEYPASDIVTAIAVGIVSGLAATGADQAFKQLYGKDSEVNGNV